MRLFARTSLLSLMLTLFSVSLVFAQASCPDLVNEALEAVDANCADLGRNEACYGYDQVEASFLSTVEDDVFSQPTDIASVADIETIRTAPLSLDNGTWGVAVMNLQANVPNTIPGQNVTFVLMGDVEVENAVAPEDAFQPADAIEVEVAVTAGANIRSGAGTNFNVLDGAGYQAILEADGRSEDGEWVRVAYRERPAWVSMSVLVDNPAIAGLPTLTSDLRTPMQAFYLRTGIGEPECNEAPDDLLLVQGPENIEIALTVNGADVSLGSSGAFRVVEIDGELFLEVIVFDGVFQIGDVKVRRGQHSLMCLGEEDSRGLDGESNDLIVNCEPTPPEAVDIDILGADWCVLEGVSANILNYALDVPCPGEIPIQTGGTTPSGRASESELADVNCSSFGLISPLSSVDAGYHVFNWSPAPGADQYFLVFFNSDGVEVNQFPTTETSYGLNLGGETQTGGSFSWQVRAYKNGAYACATQASGLIQRLYAGPPPNTGSGINVNCSFTYPYQLDGTVSWSDLGAGETITVKMTASSSTKTKSSSSSSGTINLSINDYSPGSIVVTTTGGYSYSQSCN